MQVEKNIDIVTVAGTRPEIIKLAELVRLLGGQKNNHALLYTGQHYSDNMKGVFFDELQVKPDFDLRCDTSDVLKIKDRMVEFLREVRPSYILVYGDTNSSLAGALAARELEDCTLVHIEAGLRCFDLAVPEERARIQIDSMSDYLFPPTELSKTFLKYEQIEENVFVTGNLVVDVCKRLAKVADEHGRDDLPGEYLLLTMHRQENVDDPDRLEMLRKHLAGIDHKIVFPIHPRTKANLAKFGMTLPPNVMTIEPAGYLEFLYLLKNCRLVLTDSGGVQEEAVVLKRPCVTLRHVSERWETLLVKANVLFPLYRKDSLNDVVSTMLSAKIDRNPYGENVARTMLDLLRKRIVV